MFTAQRAAMSLAVVASVGLALLALWGVSVARRDVSIVDIFWGAGFALIAWVAYLQAAAPTARGLLVAILATIWGGRLALYLGWRNHGQPEDHRYQAMRAKTGPSFVWKSLYIVFGLQGLLMLVISLPLQAAMAADAPPLGPIEAAGALLWAVGLGFETVGDAQLARFKADPANRGKVMDRGLWRYTRHPNYFGDFCIWWGFYLLAARVAPWTALSPALMSVLLLRVSGVTLLERTITARRPEYAEYIRRTPAFFPWRPRS